MQRAAACHARAGMDAQSAFLDACLLNSFQLAWGARNASSAYAYQRASPRPLPSKVKRARSQPVDDEVRGLVEAFVAEEVAPCDPGDVPTGREDIAKKAAAYLKAKDSTASHWQLLTALSDILATPEKQWRHGHGAERRQLSVFAYRDGDSHGKMCRWKGPSQHV